MMQLCEWTKGECLGTKKRRGIYCKNAKEESSVPDPDPDPPDPHVLGLPDSDPLVRCMDPDPDPSIIMQK
jgi:hypothetical protein